MPLPLSTVPGEVIVPESTVPGGFWWILGLGVLVLVAAALVDWRRDTVRERRSQQELRRHDPATRDDGVVAPEPQPSVLSAGEAERLAHDLAEVSACSARLPSMRFATHRAPDRAIARGALVLVLDEAVDDLRLVLTPLQRASAQGAPLALVAPGFGDDLLETLAANLHAGHLLVVPLVADDRARAEVAERSGATPVGSSALQSGYLPDDGYGRAELLVADTASTALVRPDSAPENTRMPTA